MRSILFITTLIHCFFAFAEDIALTIEEYDTLRNRASILVLDTTQVPLGTILRVHSKTGTCEVEITEQVNDHLIGVTRGCEAGVIQPGMKLAFSPTQSWERVPAYNEEESSVRTSYNLPGTVDEVLKRLSVHVGHNFSNELEGNVYADGHVKNLNGDTALSFGLKGQVFDFTNRIFLTTELAYETPRTFDQATFNTNGNETVGGTTGYSPRLSLWSIAVLGEAQVIDRMRAFAGFNLSIPSLRNSPFSVSSDIGFQAGANYEIIPKVAVEALVKITNMNLKNNVGETTDLSLAGLELRGRYSF